MPFAETSRRSKEYIVNITRRSMLKLATAAPLGARLLGHADAQSGAGPADHTLRISTGLIELAPDHIVSTTLYNGQFPGPVIRLREGRRTTVDLVNDTDTPEQVHWHGQNIPSDVDGAAEEGTPYVPARGARRISFVPGPAGFRFVHTHVAAECPVDGANRLGVATGPDVVVARHRHGAESYARDVKSSDRDVLHGDVAPFSE